MDKKVYSFSVPELYKGITAEEAAKELDRITNLYGELKPEYVVYEAADKNSLFHPYFTWDNNEAARLWRKKQAQNLINNVHVEIITEEIKCKVRAFVNVKEKKSEPRSYVPIQDVIENKKQYADLLAQAKDDMQSFIDTYSQLEELNSVKAEMLRVMSTI